MYLSLLTTLSSISLFVDNVDTFLKTTLLLYFWRVTEKRYRQYGINSASTRLHSMSPAFIPVHTVSFPLVIPMCQNAQNLAEHNFRARSMSRSSLNICNIFLIPVLSLHVFMPFQLRSLCLSSKGEPKKHHIHR